MEGSNYPRLPRTLIRCPVEIRLGARTISFEHAEGNLSLGGIFLPINEGFPANAALHLTISAEHSIEVDGIIRHNNLQGVGIEFVSISHHIRQKIRELIADFTPREILAAQVIATGNHSGLARSFASNETPPHI